MNMQKIIIITGLILSSTSLFAADATVGKTLVNENCQSCHNSEVYTRADHRITSREGLTKQVQRCELSLGLTWFDEDIDNAAEHLNQQFYHFEK